ncbi:MAG: hypothetical protein WD696_10920 [Bryobacteraceae bacterium]
METRSSWLTGAVLLAIANGTILVAQPAPGNVGPHIGFAYSSEMSPGKVVKQAPYSAEAVTETVQPLADGNRITRKNTASVARDAEGRTRRQEKLGAVGPWAVASEPHETIFINDPVAGVHYILDPQTKTARKLAPPTFTRATAATGQTFGIVAGSIGPGPGGPPTAGQRVEWVGEGPPLPPPPPRGDVVFHRAIPAPPAGPPLGETSTVSLGKQTIEGVIAEGTKTTTTIPAGQIGNDRPIEIVSERWYSPELQLVVSSKRNDPRFGETNFRLSLLQRSEPGRSLFEVPPDYKVVEGRSPLMNKVRSIQKPE